jgi:hypothetical protein
MHQLGRTPVEALVGAWLVSLPGGEGDVVLDLAAGVAARMIPPAVSDPRR